MTEHDVTNISGTQPRKNMITMGKVDTSDLMMIITWAMDMSFQSPKLKWASWTHTTPWCHDLMTVMASQITSLTIVYSTVYSGTDQRKHQSSALLDVVWGDSSMTGELPAQRASNAENVSIWWRHHALPLYRHRMESLRWNGPMQTKWSV